MLFGNPFGAPRIGTALPGDGGGLGYREGERTKALPGETERGTGERAGCWFLLLYYPRVTRKENKNRNPKAIKHVRKAVFAPPDEPRSCNSSFPLPAHAGEAHPQHLRAKERPPVLGYELRPRCCFPYRAAERLLGLAWLPRQPRSLDTNFCSPSLLFFAFHPPLKRTAGVSGKVFGLSPRSLSGIYLQWVEKK